MRVLGATLTPPHLEYLWTQLTSLSLENGNRGSKRSTNCWKTWRKTAPEDRVKRFALGKTQVEK